MRTVALLAALGALGMAAGPATGLYRVLVVRTGSMAPALPINAVVIETPAPRQSVRVGDVITIHPPEQPEALRTHRVVEVVRPGPTPVVRTKGDFNAAADPTPVRLERGELWRVRAVVPGAGIVIRAAGDPAVRAASAGLSALAAVGGAVAGARRRLRRPPSGGDGPERPAAVAPDDASEQPAVAPRQLGRTLVAAAVVTAAVVAGLGDKASAAMSATTSVTQASLAASTLEPPTVVTASCDTVFGDTVADISWTATASTYATGYTLYRKTGSGAFGLLATINGRATVTYEDDSVNIGSSYTYKLQSTYQSWTSVDSNTAATSIYLLC